MTLFSRLIKYVSRYLPRFLHFSRKQEIVRDHIVGVWSANNMEIIHKNIAKDSNETYTFKSISKLRSNRAFIDYEITVSSSCEQKASNVPADYRHTRASSLLFKKLAVVDNVTRGVGGVYYMIILSKIGDVQWINDNIAEDKFALRYYKSRSDTLALIAIFIAVIPAFLSLVTLLLLILQLW